MSAAILAFLVVTVVFEDHTYCVRDQAQLAFVPPNTARIIVDEQCGAITCWERWVQTDGKKIGYARACEANHGSRVNDLVPIPQDTRQP